jgi:hypothetical protein
MALLLSILVAVVLGIVLLGLALKLLGIAIAVAAGVFVYFIAERVVGQGRRNA